MLPAVQDVIVGVDHDGRPGGEIDVLFPPSRDVVVAVPGAGLQLPLEWRTFVLKKSLCSPREGRETHSTRLGTFPATAVATREKKAACIDL